MTSKNIILFIAVLFAFDCKNKKPVAISNESKIIIKEESFLERLKDKTNEVNAFMKKNDEYNKEIAFMIDMKIQSGRNRFFVVNLKNGLILKKGLVANGYGSIISDIDSLQFSNKPNSMATSIGKYKIGEMYYGKFGKSYKLYGIDNSNSNAFVRNIVLHGYNDVPEQEVNTKICYSKGCPMVSHKFFNEIDSILKKSEKSILLYIYF